MYMFLMLTLIHMAWASICQVFPKWNYSFFFFSFSIRYSLEENNYVQAIFKELRIMCQFFKNSIRTEIIWNSSTSEICLFSFIYSVMCLCQYRFKNFYSLGYNPVLLCFRAQIVPVLAIGSILLWLVYPFDILYHWWPWKFVRWRELYFFHYKMLQSPTV